MTLKWHWWVPTARIRKYLSKSWKILKNPAVMKGMNWIHRQIDPRFNKPPGLKKKKEKKERKNPPSRWCDPTSTILILPEIKRNKEEIVMAKEINKRRKQETNVKIFTIWWFPSILAKKSCFGFFRDSLGILRGTLNPIDENTQKSLKNQPEILKKRSKSFKNRQKILKIGWNPSKWSRNPANILNNTKKPRELD